MYVIVDNAILDSVRCSKVKVLKSHRVIFPPWLNDHLPYVDSNLSLTALKIFTVLNIIELFYKRLSMYTDLVKFEIYYNQK